MSGMEISCVSISVGMNYIQVSLQQISLWLNVTLNCCQPCSHLLTHGHLHSHPSFLTWLYECVLFNNKQANLKDTWEIPVRYRFPAPFKSSKEHDDMFVHQPSSYLEENRQRILIKMTQQCQIFTFEVIMAPILRGFFLNGLHFVQLPLLSSISNLLDSLFSHLVHEDIWILSSQLVLG